METALITLSATDLLKMSQAGKLVRGALVSESKSGYLFFGPYIHLTQGEYELVLYGDFTQTNSAILDIVSAAGKKVFLREKLAARDLGSGDIAFDFSLPEDVSGVEVRLLVTDQDRLSVERYLIQKK